MNYESAQLKNEIDKEMMRQSTVLDEKIRKICSQKKEDDKLLLIAVTRKVKKEFSDNKRTMKKTMKDNEKKTKKNAESDSRRQIKEEKKNKKNAETALKLQLKNEKKGNKKEEKKELQLTSSLPFVPPVGRTGLETQWVSPQERSPVLSGIKPTVSGNADSSEKSRSDFVDLSKINQLELTKSIIEYLRSGVETLRYQLYNWSR